MYKKLEGVELAEESEILAIASGQTTPIRPLDYHEDLQAVSLEQANFDSIVQETYDSSSIGQQAFGHESPSNPSATPFSQKDLDKALNGIEAQAATAEATPLSRDTSGVALKYYMNAVTAQSYGHLNAKFLRAKCFHEYLVSKLLNADGKLKNNGVFAFKTIYREMPFDLYLKLVGVFSETSQPAVDEYLASPVTLTMDEIGGELKGLVFRQKSKMRSGLLMLMKILDKLELIERISSLESDDDGWEAEFSGKWKLNRRAPLFFVVGGTSKSFVRYATIDSGESAMDYWVYLLLIQFHLQYLCGEKKKESEGLIQPLDSCLAGIGNARNWIPPAVYEKDQKTKLAEYTNVKTGESPYRDTVRCKVLCF